jgi:arylsulfatase
VHNWVSVAEYRTTSEPVVGAGVRELAMRFTKTKEHAGTVELLVDGTVVGTGEVPHFVPTRFSITGECLYVGSDAGLPVTLDYRPPFRFTGTLHRVTVDVSGEPHVDAVADAELAVRSQ